MGRSSLYCYLPVIIIFITVSVIITQLLNPNNVRVGAIWYYIINNTKRRGAFGRETAINTDQRSSVFVAVSGLKVLFALSIIEYVTAPRVELLRPRARKVLRCR